VRPASRPRRHSNNCSRSTDRCSAALAKKLESDAPAGGASRIRRAYAILFNREPTQKEIKLARAFLGENPNADAWSRYAHVLLGSNEFMFID
jgi:hypothetical protein